MSPRAQRPEAPRLFEADQLQLRRTGAARLRDIAARSPEAALTIGEARRIEEERALSRLRTQGVDLCTRFGLRWKCLIKERDGVNGHYGICYEDGEIRIRLRHARTGRLLKESSLVDTLCHELAHLKHLDHSKRFQRLYEKILAEARSLGYYRPGPTELRRPQQLSLFGGGCGTLIRRRR